MSNFKMLPAVFAATLAAVKGGTSLEAHAKVAVTHGFAPSVADFVSAYNVKFASEAESISLAGISLPTKSNSKAVKVAALAVETHNKEYPSAPRALAVKSDGTFYLVSLPKARKARKTDGTVATGSRKSSWDIAVQCCEEDGYTIDKEGTSKRSGGEGITYFVNGTRCDGHLSKVLYRELPDDSTTVSELTKYRYVR